MTGHWPGLVTKCCPDYVQGGSEVWPYACQNWRGSQWCRLPGHTCRCKSHWLGWVEKMLLRFKEDRP